MKVKVYSKENEKYKEYRNVYMKITDLTKEENSLIGDLIRNMRTLGTVENSYFIDMIMEVLENTNLLGGVLNRMGGVDRFLDPSEGIPVRKELVTEKALNELAESLGRFFAQLLSESVDIPEVNEVIAEINVPDNVKNELLRRGIDIKYKGTISLAKGRGFQDIMLIGEFKGFVEIPEVALWIPEYLKRIYYKDTVIELYPRFFLNSPGCAVCSTEWWNIRKSPTFYPEPDYEAIVKEKVISIKESINKSIDNLIKIGAFNLLIAIAYKKLEYDGKVEMSDGRILKIKGFPVQAFPLEVSFSVRRDWMLGDVYVDLVLNNLHLEDVKNNKNKYFIIGPYRGEGLAQVMIPIIYGEDYGVLQFVRKEYKSDFASFGKSLTSLEVIKERYERILKGDFSVLDEVMHSDTEILNSFIDEIQKATLAYANVSRDEELETEVDVSQVMSDKQKEKIVSYLVAQKIKNSMMGD